MKLVKNASGKMSIKLSKSDWLNIGQKQGWVKKAQVTYPPGIDPGYEYPAEENSPPSTELDDEHYNFLHYNFLQSELDKMSSIQLEHKFLEAKTIISMIEAMRAAAAYREKESKRRSTFDQR